MVQEHVCAFPAQVVLATQALTTVPFCDADHAVGIQNAGVRPSACMAQPSAVADTSVAVPTCDSSASSLPGAVTTAWSATHPSSGHTAATATAPSDSASHASSCTATLDTAAHTPAKPANITSAASTAASSDATAAGTSQATLAAGHAALPARTAAATAAAASPAAAWDWLGPDLTSRLGRIAMSQSLRQEMAVMDPGLAAGIYDSLEAPAHMWLAAARSAKPLRF